MAEKKIDLQALPMAENDVNEQPLEKGDQNKGEEISTEDHPLEVSPKEAATEQGHPVDVNLDMESNMINLKTPQEIKGVQEPEPSEAIEAAQETKPSQVTEGSPEPKFSEVIETAQETKPSQVTETSQEPEPSQIIEAGQEKEKEERGLGGVDLNQEGTYVVSDSTPAAAKVLFDLNVIDVEDLENQILAPSDLHESPREVNQSMHERLNIDLNHCHEEGDGFPSPPASPPPSSSSSGLQSCMKEHFDRNGTEEPNIHNYAAHDAAAVRIIATNVTIGPERNKGGVPETLNLPSNRRAPKLFGFSLGGMAIDENHLLPLFCSSSTGGLKRKEPEGGLEACMPPRSSKEPKLFGCSIDGAAVTCSPSAVDEPRLLPLFCTSPTGGLKRKEPEEPYMTADKEPEGGQEAYVAGTKKARSS